jgi:two-component system, OmpR family, KDP operon response regulator KdpE
MGSRILIADNDEATRRVLEVNLRARGYTVDVAGSAAGGLVLARRQPSLAIIDLGLPDLPGTVLISQLRAGSAVPIVAISGQGPGLAEPAALYAGADCYLAKPFPIGRLLAAVYALLGDSLRAAQQARV